MDGRPGQLKHYEKASEIPKNAVILTDDEVLRIQSKRIINWKPPSEVWPLKFGAGITAGTTALSAILINHHFRVQYGLGSLAIMSTYLPSVIIPSVMTLLGHQQLVTEKLLLGRIPACEMCLGIRSGVLQSVLGVFYPMLIAPLACIVVARKHHTYAVPPINQPKEMMGMLRQVLPSQSRFLLLCALNLSLGMWMEYTEQKSAFATVLKRSSEDTDFSKEGF